MVNISICKNHILTKVTFPKSNAKNLKDSHLYIHPNWDTPLDQLEDSFFSSLATILFCPSLQICPSYAISPLPRSARYRVGVVLFTTDDGGLVEGLGEDPKIALDNSGASSTAFKTC